MGSSLHEYERFFRLERGGAADIWLAVRKGPAGFRKLLVIKQLHPELAADPTFVSLFLDEARLSAELSHPNIIQTLEVDGAGIEFFLVLEYLEGQTLSAIRQHVRLPLPLEVTICRDVLRALEYAHDLRGLSGTQLGIVHRDINPDHVFVTYEGIPKLTDFGVAKATNRRTRAITGLFHGRARYASPEQVTRGAVDRRTDLFAVGAILWEGLVGQRLWGERTEIEILRDLGQGKVPPVPLKVRACEPELARICDRALAVTPGDRFETAAEFRDELESYLKARSVGIEPRALADLLGKQFAEQRVRLRFAIEEELMKLRARGTQEIPLIPSRSEQRDSDVLDDLDRSLLDPTLSHLVLRRRIATEALTSYEAVDMRTQLSVTVEIHERVLFESIQQRVRDLVAAHHPTLCCVIDAGPLTATQGSYLVRERPAGRPLEVLLNDHGCIAAVDAVDVVIELGRSLVSAHRQGFFHGEISASTVWLQGYAGTYSLKLSGLPLFPERSERRGGTDWVTSSITPRHDVRALAALLFRLVTGHHPGPPPHDGMIHPIILECYPDLGNLLERCSSASLQPWLDLRAFLADLERLDRSRLLSLTGSGHRLRAGKSHTSLSRPITAPRRVRDESRHDIWVFTTDPVFMNPEIVRGLESAGHLGTVTWIREETHRDLLEQAKYGTLDPPSLLVFGDRDLIEGDPLLALLTDVPEVSRMMISASADEELLHRAANEIGIDRHIHPPCSAASVVTAIGGVLQRAASVRQLAAGFRTALLQMQVSGLDAAIALSRHRSLPIVVAPTDVRSDQFGVA